MSTHRVLTVLVVTLVMVSGCAGSGPATDGQAETQTQTPTDAGAEGGNQQQAASGSDWCPAGQETMFANPESGEQVSLVVEGMVTHEGREVCKAVWEGSSDTSNVVKIEMYFSEDDSYQNVIMYDANGNVVSEIESSDGTGQADTQTAADSGGDGSAEQWCPEGQSVQVANPQTGERASLVYEGIVTHEGREVCKAVWEGSSGDGNIAKIVMFFNEDETFQKTIFYDENGNVVMESEQSS